MNTMSIRKVSEAAFAAVLACTQIVPVKAESTEYKMYSYHFTPHEITNTDYADEMAYSDDYFKDDASVYNNHLATASMSLASSSISANAVRNDDLSINCYDNGTLTALNKKNTSASDTYWYKSENLQELLTNLGFADFEVNKNYTVQPGEQTIGAGVATKKITENGKTYTLIAIVPRSAGYEKEWAGNFTIGDGSNSDGFAEGFYNAMTEVVRFSADSIQRHGISGDAKIWTVGYSRGAATANLTAGWYADHAASDPRLANISLQREDIYAYTFGTPAGVHYDTAAEKEALHTSYAFIHNVFAAYDPVSMLALDQWGFTRYGTDHTLNAGYDTSSHQDTNTSAMLSYLKQLNPTVYDIYSTGGGDPDVFSPKKFSLANGSLSIVNDTSADILDTYKSQETFLQGRLGFLAKNLIKTREDYVKYQPVIQAFMVIYLGDYSDRPSNMMKYLTGDVLAKAVVCVMYAQYVISRLQEKLVTTVDGLSESEKAQLKAAADMADQLLADTENFSQEEIDEINHQLAQYGTGLTFSEVRTYLQLASAALNSQETLKQVSSLLNFASTNIMAAAFSSAMKAAGYASDEIQRLTGVKGVNVSYLVKFLSALMLGSDGYTSSSQGEQYNELLISENGKLQLNLESDQLRVLATLVGNGGSYMRVHNNEVILSWLRTQDSYFTPKTEDSTKDKDDYVVPDTSVRYWN